MPKNQEINYIFMPAGITGDWYDITENFHGTFAEFLQYHDIVFDDDCEFCRIKRYEGDTCTRYIIRATGLRVSVNLSKFKVL